MIKAQALANFIMEFSTTSYPDTTANPDPDPTNPDWLEGSKTWVLYRDGASNQSGCGAGVIVIDPEGIECSHCFRFEFKATNNEVEYEALIAGIGVAEALMADFLLIKSDS